jgi:hypothetical protein
MLGMGISHCGNRRCVGVLRRRALLDVVGEQHHGVAVVGDLEAPCLPLFGQLTGNEIEVGFSALAAIAARSSGDH